MCTAKRKFNLNPVILLWLLEGLIELSLQWNTKGLLNDFKNLSTDMKFVSVLPHLKMKLIFVYT